MPEELEITQPTPYLEPVPPPPTFRRLLFGDDGLRAGWSVLLFVLLLAGVGIGAGKGLTSLNHHYHFLPTPAPRSPASSTMTPRVALVGESLQFLIFLIPAFIMSRVERRPFARYGLTGRQGLPDFLKGLFWGLVLLSLLVGALVLAHGLVFDGVALHGSIAAIYALKWLLIFFLVGLAEEFLFRGYLQYTVSRGVAGITRAMDARNGYSHVIGFWVAAGLFSVLLFMLAHLGNGGETVYGILAVGLAGAVFAFSLYRTGSLWWGIGMHTSWDWAQSYLYGTPDSGNLVQGHLLASHPIGSKLLSGGQDGPEGSLLVIPTLLLAALVIHFTLPRRVYPLTPDQSPPEDLLLVPEPPVSLGVPQ